MKYEKDYAMIISEKNIIRKNKSKTNKNTSAVKKSPDSSNVWFMEMSSAWLYTCINFIHNFCNYVANILTVMFIIYTWTNNVILYIKVLQCYF